MTPDEHNPEGTDFAAQGHALAANAIMKKWKRKQKFCDDAPTPPTPTPTLPEEVREAINAAAKKINLRLNTTHYVDIAGIIRDALAPLWPRPAPVTADARELAERIHKAVFAGESHPDAETDAIAAVLAPVLAELEEALELVRDLEAASFKNHEEREQLRTYAASLLARAEAAERDAAEVRKAWNEREPQLLAAEVERDDLRADNHRLDAEIGVLEAQLAAAQADKERLDWLANQGVCWRDCNKHDTAWVVGPGTEWAYRPECVRAAIDAARREGGAK